MAKAPWNIRPPKKRVPVSASLQAEVERQAIELIANVLKPRHIVPPTGDAQFNYITDIGSRWQRGYFYFFSVYACPSPNALSPSFESPFARMVPAGGGKFDLYFMRYTGKEWVGIFDALSVDECIEAIQAGEWFQP